MSKTKQQKPPRDINSLRARFNLAPTQFLPTHVHIKLAAELLGVSKEVLLNARKGGKLKAIRPKHVASGHDKGWYIHLLVVSQLIDNSPRWLQEKQNAEKNRKAARAKQVANSNKIQINIPVRKVKPQSVVCHLGPTNSGKTYDALQFLAKRGAGVYAAPLRMLAQESYQKLCDSVGKDKVGLITGEERINENAPIICCTAEMAPMKGEVLVLDEVHWASDKERGSAWSRLLLGANYKHWRLVGAWDAKPLLTKVFPDADFVYHERRCPLDWAGEFKADKLPAKSVVIAFSRKAVLSLASELNKYRPGKIGILYGAMPLAARKVEIERFIKGDTEVIVATDVLGHGVNLPCDYVIFAESNKFDGEMRRDLSGWEVGQIAGRAGRFGLSTAGYVGHLTGVSWLRADPNLLKRSLKPTQVVDGQKVYRIVSRGRFAPRLEDLGITKPSELPSALLAWQNKAKTVFAQHPWLQVEDVAPLIDLYTLIDRHTPKINRTELEDVWGLMHAPIDAERDELILAELTSGLFDNASLAHQIKLVPDPKTSLIQAEKLAGKAAILRWFVHRFPGVGDIDIKDVAQMEKAYAEKVSELVRSMVETAPEHTCKSCDNLRAPWNEYCDDCYQELRSWRNDSRW